MTTFSQHNQRYGAPRREGSIASGAGAGLTAIMQLLLMLQQSEERRLERRQRVLENKQKLELGQQAIDRGKNEARRAKERQDAEDDILNNQKSLSDQMVEVKAALKEVEIEMPKRQLDQLKQLIKTTWAEHQRAEKREPLIIEKMEQDLAAGKTENEVNATSAKARGAAPGKQLEKLQQGIDATAQAMEQSGKAFPVEMEGKIAATRTATVGAEVAEATKGDQIERSALQNMAIEGSIDESNQRLDNMTNDQRRAKHAEIKNRVDTTTGGFAATEMQRQAQRLQQYKLGFETMRAYRKGFPSMAGPQGMQLENQKLTQLEQQGTITGNMKAFLQASANRPDPSRSTRVLPPDRDAQVSAMSDILRGYNDAMAGYAKAAYKYRAALNEGALAEGITPPAEWNPETVDDEVRSQLDFVSPITEDKGDELNEIIKEAAGVYVAQNRGPGAANAIDPFNDPFLYMFEDGNGNVDPKFEKRYAGSVGILTNARVKSLATPNMRDDVLIEVLGAYHIPEAEAREIIDDLFPDGYTAQYQGDVDKWSETVVREALAVKASGKEITEDVVDRWPETKKLVEEALVREGLGETAFTLAMDELGMTFEQATAARKEVLKDQNAGIDKLIKGAKISQLKKIQASGLAGNRASMDQLPDEAIAGLSQRDMLKGRNYRKEWQEKFPVEKYLNEKAGSYELPRSEDREEIKYDADGHEVRPGDDNLQKLIDQNQKPQGGAPSQEPEAPAPQAPAPQAPAAQGAPDQSGSQMPPGFGEGVKAALSALGQLQQEASANIDEQSAMGPSAELATPGAAPGPGGAPPPAALPEGIDGLLQLIQQNQPAPR